jgi:hypothetical protein
MHQVRHCDFSDEPNGWVQIWGQSLEALDIASAAAIIVILDPRAPWTLPKALWKNGAQ